MTTHLTKRAVQVLKFQEPTGKPAIVCGAAGLERGGDFTDQNRTEQHLQWALLNIRGHSGGSWKRKPHLDLAVAVVELATGHDHLEGRLAALLVGRMGDPLALGFLFGAKRQNGAAMDDIARAQHGTIDGQMTVLDPAGQARAGILIEELSGDLIETLATEFTGNLGAMLNDFRHGLLQRALSLWFRLRACG